MVHLLLLNTKGEGNMLMFQNKKQDENLVFYFLTYFLLDLNKIILSLIEDTFVYITERQFIIRN